MAFAVFTAIIRDDPLSNPDGYATNGFGGAICRGSARSRTSKQKT